MGLRAHPRIVPYPNWYGRPNLVGSPRRGDRIGLPFRPARRANPAILENCFVVDARFTDAPSLSSLLFITLATPHYTHYGSPLTTAHLPLRLTSHYAHHGRTRRRMCWGQSPPHARHRLVGTVPSSDGGQSPQPGGISPVLGSAAHHGDSPPIPHFTTMGTVPTSRPPPHSGDSPLV